jgi:acetate kinase
MAQVFHQLVAEVDPEANNSSARGERDISRPDGRVRVLVVPTNEELMIARETAQVVEGGQ